MAFRRTKKDWDEASLYEYAVGALGRRMRSVAELKRLMRQRVPDDELGRLLIETVIARLKEQKYLNDAAYAAAYSSYRKENEKFGRLRVITDLKARGVHGEVIEKAVAASYEDVDEERLARAYLRRKRMEKPKDQKQAARVFRNLIRAGFAKNTAVRILKNWDVDDDTITALETEESS